MQLDGSFPALITPLLDPGSLAEDDVRRLCVRALDDGASGVLVAGSTGEGTLLEPGQRERLTVLAREALDGVHAGTSTSSGARATLLACASGPTVASLDEDVARLHAAGADAVLVLAPAVQPLHPEEVVELHLGVADRSDAPTLVYHIPQFTNSSLTPEAVASLAHHERIVGMKDSSPDAERRAAFAAAALRARADGHAFALFTGHAASLRQALLDGADGSITALANVRQRQVVALHTAVAAGDVSESLRLQEALAKAARGIAAVGASTPAVLKAALQLEGVVVERWCRPPLRSVAPPALDRVRSALLP